MSQADSQAPEEHKEGSSFLGNQKSGKRDLPGSRKSRKDNAVIKKARARSNTASASFQEPGSKATQGPPNNYQMKPGKGESTFFAKLRLGKFLE